MAKKKLSQEEARERIAARAYELYLARGAEDGRADEDWYSAERELSNGGRSREETSRNTAAGESSRERYGDEGSRDRAAEETSREP